MLLMKQKMEEILTSRDKAIFLLQHPSFILSLQKFIFQMTSRDGVTLPFLTVNYVKLTISLSQQKPQKIQDQCQDLYVNGFVTELTKLIVL